MGALTLGALTRRRSERGFALLIVLWSVVLLTAITSGMTASGRSDVQLAANLRASAEAEAAADGAVYEAAYHLLSRDAAWTADGHPIATGRPGVAVRLCIVNEAGKINPNSANAGLMAALLRTIGVDATTSARLAAAIFDWRSAGDTPSPAGAKLAQYREAGLPYGPSGVAFTSVDELGLVLGMTPDLLQRLRPYLTVFTDADTDPRAASPVVLAALRTLVGTDPTSLTIATAPNTVTVTAAAQTRSGGRFIRRATIRLGTGSDQQLLRILTWEEPDSSASCQ